jgi:hypothetical protein
MFSQGSSTTPDSSTNLADEIVLIEMSSTAASELAGNGLRRSSSLGMGRKEMMWGRLWPKHEKGCQLYMHTFSFLLIQQ